MKQSALVVALLALALTACGGEKPAETAPVAPAVVEAASAPAVVEAVSAPAASDAASAPAATEAASAPAAAK